MSWRRRSRSDWGRLGMRCELNSICTYRKGKTKVAGLSPTTYISTENMLPNKGGIIASSSLPNCLTTQEFQTGDVLVSNIRPYFKKIWLAEYCGGCSNDVLVFTANKEIDAIFLYYVLFLFCHCMFVVCICSRLFIEIHQFSSHNSKFFHFF